VQGALRLSPSLTEAEQDPVSGIESADCPSNLCVDSFAYCVIWSGWCSALKADPFENPPSAGGKHRFVASAFQAQELLPIPSELLIAVASTTRQYEIGGMVSTPRSRGHKMIGMPLPSLSVKEIAGVGASRSKVLPKLVYGPPTRIPIKDTV
jgi:hypothetical protein